VWQTDRLQHFPRLATASRWTDVGVSTTFQIKIAGKNGNVENQQKVPLCQASRNRGNEFSVYEIAELIYFGRRRHVELADCWMLDVIGQRHNASERALCSVVWLVTKKTPVEIACQNWCYCFLVDLRLYYGKLKGAKFSHGTSVKRPFVDITLLLGHIETWFWCL